MKHKGIICHRLAIQRRRGSDTQHYGYHSRDALIVVLCRLYRHCQSVEYPYVLAETDILCAADMHDVFDGLFIYISRLAPAAACDAERLDVLGQFGLLDVGQEVADESPLLVVLRRGVDFVEPEHAVHHLGCRGLRLKLLAHPCQRDAVGRAVGQESVPAPLGGAFSGGGRLLS